MTFSISNMPGSLLGRFVILIALVAGVLPLQASDGALSLSDLANLKPPSLLVNMKENLSFDINPSAVTVINSRDIELTPARDIYDLIEIYVPGAIWMAHNEGAHPGIRGIISDRNYKFLLLVNGMVVNEKFANGATSELENWDLSDIEQIEIVRGPGSVTFGPGAVMGVINIITKKPVEGTGISAQATTVYNSYKVTYSNGVIKDAYKLFVHASVTKTGGLDNPKAFCVSGVRGEAGYIGKDFVIDTNLRRYPPPNYYRDDRDRPQVKAIIDLQFLNNARAWVRYTNMGDAGLHGYAQAMHQEPLLTKPNDTIPDIGIIQNMTILKFTGTPQNIRGRSIRQLSGNLEKSTEINQDISLDIKAQALSTDVEIRKNQSKSVSFDYSVFDRYSENSASGQALLNIIFGPHKLAAGIEANVTEWNRGWGSPEIYMADVLQKPKSPLNIPKGWHYNTFSALAEGLFRLGNPELYALVSMRMDNICRGLFNQMLSKPLLSPRFGLIGNFGSAGTYKLLAQQSTRSATAADIYRAFISPDSVKANGATPDPEVLSGVEFIYQNAFNNRLQLESNLFVNDVQSMAWGSNRTTLVGEQIIGGCEVSLAYAGNKFKLGGSQTYTKQLDMWHYKENFSKLTKIRSGLSYHDYYYKADDDSTIIFTSEGNELSNWPNMATKMFINFTPIEKWTIHLDAHGMYDWAGEQAGLTMIEKAAAGTKYDTTIQRIMNIVKDKDAYTVDLRFNLSVEWKVNSIFAISGYIMNLQGLYSNKRYNYSSGHQNVKSNKINWNEEPMVSGMRVSCNL